MARRWRLLVLKVVLYRGSFYSMSNRRLALYRLAQPPLAQYHRHCVALQSAVATACQPLPRQSSLRWIGLGSTVSSTSGSLNGWVVPYAGSLQKEEERVSSSTTSNNQVLRRQHDGGVGVVEGPD